MLGLYGGSAREYNPGSFMIGWQTYQELSKRFPGAEIHLYSHDVGGEYDDVWTEEEDGLEFRFFCGHKSAEVLDEWLTDYDAVVIGGDNVWGQPKRRPIFSLGPSPKFVAASKPVVALNSISALAPRDELLLQREELVRACSRAVYRSVRAPHLKSVLVDDFGVEDVSSVPDPVLGVDPELLLSKVEYPRIPRNGKRVLGVAVTPVMVNALIDAMKQLGTALADFDVWVYSFSRVYAHLESVHRMKKAFGARFNYIERNLSPLEAYAIVSQFDVSLNDTYHGTVAALIHGKPFITTRYREPVRSRRSQLFALLGMEDESIPFTSNAPRMGGYASHVPVLVTGGGVTGMADPMPGRHAADVRILADGLAKLLRRPQHASDAAMSRVRASLDRHFSDMTDRILSALA